MQVIEGRIVAFGASTTQNASDYSKQITTYSSVEFETEKSERILVPNVVVGAVVERSVRISARGKFLIWNAVINKNPSKCQNMIVAIKQSDGATYNDYDRLKHDLKQIRWIGIVWIMFGLVLLPFSFVIVGLVGFYFIYLGIKSWRISFQGPTRDQVDSLLKL